MAKKAKLPLLYLIGVIAVVVGFCLPIFKGNILGTTANGFSFIDFEHSGFVTIGALLIFSGAVVGIISCFISQMSKLKLLFIIISIVGGVILIIGFTTNGGFYKAIGKGFLKHAYVGFYIILVGWVLGLIGAITSK